MKQTIISVILASLLLMTASSSSAAEPKPVEVKQGDKCQVCGMFVAKYKEWIAQVIFSDGTYSAFDGPKDMFKYYFNLPKYNPSKKQADIRAIYVTEYYSTKLMDARKMFFVSGSNVYGPMGSEFVPLESEQKAKEFMKDHNGKKVLRFTDITKEALE